MRQKSLQKIAVQPWSHISPMETRISVILGKRRISLAEGGSAGMRSSAM